MTLLNPGASYATDKITLTCSGTMKVTDLIGHESTGSPISTSFVVDLDEGTVATTTGVFRIGNVTENHIDFQGNSGGGDVRGRIDRISGTAGMSIRENGRNIWTMFELNCKPAKPLF